MPLVIFAAAFQRYAIFSPRCFAWASTPSFSADAFSLIVHQEHIIATPHRSHSVARIRATSVFSNGKRAAAHLPPLPFTEIQPITSSQGRQASTRRRRRPTEHFATRRPTPRSSAEARPLPRHRHAFAQHAGALEYQRREDAEIYGASPH
jgi:hypothetical protein